MLCSYIQPINIRLQNIRFFNIMLIFLASSRCKIPKENYTSLLTSYKNSACLDRFVNVIYDLSRSTTVTLYNYFMSVSNKVTIDSNPDKNNIEIFL